MMFCPTCGAPNEDEAAFCGNCGALLKPEEQPAQPGVEEQAVQPGIEEPGGGELPEVSAEVAAPAEAEGPPPEPALPEEAEVIPAPPPYRPAPVPVPAALPTSGLSIASLVLGIGGLTVVPLLGSILAVILGYMARKEIRSRPTEITGAGMATAGLVLGWIGIGLAVLGVLGVAAVSICAICGFVPYNY